MNTILDSLNEMQKGAVTHTDGPILILAGAGSGKTKTLTHRIAYLLLEKKIDAERILAVTFTNKAAGEMRQRVSTLLEEVQGRSVNLPWLGTFHAMCVRILRREAARVGISPRFTIYDTQDQKQLVKHSLTELRLDPKQFQPGAVLAFISGAKNELMRPEQYANYASGYYQETIARIYEQYQRKLTEANAVDFDDLLMLTVEVLSTHEDILRKYQTLFQYILIDEYQDTNKAQYKLTQMLAAKHHNICVVGDDYQAIYSFRGANFRNILDFEHDYPDATVVKLEQNYRSTKTILDGASAIIAKNVHRTDKKLWTGNDTGLPITVYEALNELDEAEFMVRECLALKRSGLFQGLKSMAILYRTNAQSRVIEEAFLNVRIPYRIVGGIRFYERKEVKDAIAYLRLLVNPADRVSLDRVLNTPPRGIGRKSFAAIVANMPQALSSPDITQFELSGKAASGFVQFRAVLSSARQAYQQGQDLVSVFAQLMQESGYLDWLDDGTPEGQSRVENMQELKSVLSRDQSLESFLENVSLVSDVDEYDENIDAVTLMTIHAAKGLEFPIVFICGMEEGVFPHSRSAYDPAEIEEERRLCYVGMTRAKSRLYLLYARERRLYGGLQINPPSRFVHDLPVELVDYL